MTGTILFSSNGSNNLPSFSLSYLKDNSNSLKAKDILSKLKENDSVFKPIKNKSNFGYSKSTFWLKVEINTKLKPNGPLLLLIDPPQIDKVELYTIDKSYNILDQRLTGDKYPFHQRELLHRKFLFKISTQLSNTYLIKLASTSYIPVNLTLLSENGFIKNEMKETLLYGVFLGVSIILFILNMVIFFSKKRPEFLFYSIYIICFNLLTASISGFAFQFLYPNTPEFQEVSHIWFLAISNVVIYIFLNFYFEVNRSEKLNKIREFFIILWLIPLTLTFLPSFEFTKNSANILIFSNFVLFFLMIFKYWKEKNKESKILLIAFSCIILGGTCQILYVNGILPHTFFFYNGSTLGGLLQMIVFSLGLVFKVKEYQEKNLEKKSFQIDSNEKINKILKQEVLKKTEALEKKNQRLKEYDFIVAHDLKNPLGAILSYTEIFELKGGNDPEKTKRIIKNIRDVTFKAIDIIDGLLKVVTSGSLELRKHSIELLIKWAISQLTTKINETNTKIHQDLSILSFFCDDVSMEQVFANLIENSIKYKHPDKDPVIHINSWEESGRIFISFKDNGIGINDKIKLDVFLKDFRGDINNNNNINGYGLGLYHVKSLVHENKGSVEITHSSPKDGTTITLAFLIDP